MNDINKMPPVCGYCPYWEVCKPPYICPDIGDKEPETHDKRAEMHACDLIDRRAAILAIKTRQWLTEGAKEALVDQLERLPSAQPESAKRTAETAQNVSDEDLISRKAAMNRIDEALVHVFVDSHGCGESVLRRLPSVKPKRKQGHWVGIDDEPYETWECDQCGCIQECFDGEQPNYCPNCGADMREVDDERPD